MPVPLLDLRAQHATIRESVVDAMMRVVDDQAFILGEPVKRFECEVAGLSHAKTVALRSLAEHVLAGELELSALEAEPDEQVTRELVAVKGIGEWTAHMFLIFTLGREDVLPLGDLGIRTAFTRAYGVTTRPEMTAIAEPWRPYRSRASLYLWRSII